MVFAGSRLDQSSNEVHLNEGSTVVQLIVDSKEVLGWEGGAKAGEREHKTPIRPGPREHKTPIMQAAGPVSASNVTTTIKRDPIRLRLGDGKAL